MNMLTKFWRWIKGAPTTNKRLTLYMKSGNMIELDCVTEWSVTPSEHGVSSLKLKQYGKGAHLVVQSVCLEQIEAIAYYFD